MKKMVNSKGSISKKMDIRKYFISLCCIVFYVLISTNVMAYSNMVIGDYLVMGSYNNEPILWRCVLVDENGALMLSDKSLCQKAYDAPTSLNATTGSHSRDSESGSQFGSRMTKGSNYWADSNIRSWLNSNALENEVEWLCGNPPTEAVLGDNAYDKEAGFLSNFSQSEQSAIKLVTQRSAVNWQEQAKGKYSVGSEDYKWTQQHISQLLSNYDTTAYAEFVEDKMFLLDVKQLNALYTNKHILGEHYYIAYPTSYYLNSSDEYTKMQAQNPFDWLRTPQCYYESYGTSVLANCPGEYGQAYPASQALFIRPAFYLDNQAEDTLLGAGTIDNPYMIDDSMLYHQDIKVIIDNQEVVFDQKPILCNGRLLFSMRKVFESLKATVTWDGVNRIATAVEANDSISFSVNSSNIVVNGENKTIDVPAKLICSTTMVPIRAISEAFNYKVEWDGENKTVSIFTR